jgi:hypothetical protein
MWFRRNRIRHKGTGEVGVLICKGRAGDIPGVWVRVPPESVPVWWAKAAVRRVR